MHPLSQFDLPLQPYGPPTGFGWAERDMSTTSGTTAFDTGLNERDSFLGQPSCIVCGDDGPAIPQHCHIIPQSERSTWADLKEKNWVPRCAKANPQHEPRNGILMCPTHHTYFNRYFFFIRFVPNIRKFIFINYSGQAALDKYHGKAIMLDIDHRHAPFPTLFIIHEMRVRGFHPFQAVTPPIPDQVSWQDWISERDGDTSNPSSAVIRSPSHGSPTPQPQSSLSQHTLGGGGSTLALLTNDLIAEILAATQALPSWKVCTMEGTRWDGTGDANIQKYIRTVGLQHDV